MMKQKLLLFLLLMILGSGFARGQQITLVSGLTDNGEGFSLLKYATMGGRLYFMIRTDMKVVLWSTDGTPANTSPIFDWPLTRSTSSPGDMKEFNNKLYFGADDGIHGDELWATDGTTAGTAMLKDIRAGRFPGIDLTVDAPMRELNGRLYFNGSDSAQQYTIWSTDGTAANTVQSIALPGADQFSSFIYPHLLEVANGSLYFSGSENKQPVAFWSSDGTQSGTTQIAALFSGAYIPFGNRLLFSSYGLGISDGTAAGTTILDSSKAWTDEHVAYKNELVLFARNKVYATNATIGGTRVIVDSLPFMQKHVFPAVLHSRIYFCSDDALWSSDGTTSGTVPVKALLKDSGNFYMPEPTGLTVAGGRLFFRKFDSNRVELFTSDGTAGGTAAVNMPGANFRYSEQFGNKYALARSIMVEPLMAFNNELYFTALYDSAIGKALYKVEMPAANVAREGKADDQLVVVPNPSTGTLNIRYPVNAFSSAEVVNGTGHTVWSQLVSPSGKERIDLNHLPAGTYFIRLSGTGVPITAPVILVR